uniref:Pr6Pr family membrane protein n=1 Tax=Schistosoma mansoni TaxID=6183 RepID=A0A5K4F7R5_SCHMA
MLQKTDLRRIIGAIYHIIVLGIFITITVVGYKYIYPGQSFNIMNLLVLFKYITFITMTMIQVYFVNSTLLLMCKQYTVHSYFYVLSFTYAWTILVMYFIVLIVDHTVATENPELKNMPLWFNHTCHIIPAVVTLLEAFICRPKSVSLWKSFVVCYILMTVYNIYMEVSIVALQFSPYPKLDKIPTVYRYLVYLISWGLVTIFTLVSYGILRFIRRNDNDIGEHIIE